jgi:RNA polymerase sigma factor (sigma-70 family)
VAGNPILATLARDLDEGFVDLFHGYRQLVFSTALRVSGRWADAEDLTAEAFLRAYRALCGYDRDRIASLEIRAWLVTILLNAWRNSVRSAARRPAPAPLEDAPDPPDPREGVEEAVGRRETGRELADLLALLPEDQRVAIVLRHVSDLSIAEIATVLRCPQGTVKSHISRGLRRLRALQADPGSQAPDHLARGAS